MADNLRNTPRRMKMIRPTNIRESPPKRLEKQPPSTAAISLKEEFTMKSYLQTEIIGEYRILKTIGEGNFAKVKLAVHEPTGIEVAIKIVDKTKLSSQNLPKINREVKAMSKVNHPNIVKLYQVMDNDTTLYLVMEYAQRGELYDYLTSNFKMSEKEARGMFRQVVSAVHYCHQRLIVHRDLKTENLLLKVENGRMNIRLADFGFCNKYTLDGKLDTFCGSPPYAAPELFKGLKYTGPEVDSWSLGVLLYVMVTGVLPFDGSNLSQLRDCVLRGKFKVPFFMSTECESLIRKLLVLDASKRYTLEQIMEHPWISIGFENDKMKPYAEPKITSFGKMQINKIAALGYTNKQIYTSLVNQNFSDHIYATYLILGGKIRNLGNSSKKSKCNKPECHNSTYINHCNFHDRIAEFFNNLENDAANKQKALRCHRNVTKHRSQLPMLKVEPPTPKPEVESPKTKAVPQNSVPPKPSEMGNLRMARGAFTPVNRHSIRDSTKLLSERKELKNSDESNQFIRGNNFRATFHAGQRCAKRLTPDGSTDNERNFFQRLTSRFSKRFNLFSPKRKSEEDNNENKD